MRTLFIFIQILFAATCLAQDSYSVIYKYENRFSSITVNGEKNVFPALSDRLVFNDSLSFWYRIPQGGDPLKKTKPLATKSGTMLFCTISIQAAIIVK